MLIIYRFGSTVSDMTAQEQLTLTAIGLYRGITVVIALQDRRYFRLPDTIHWELTCIVDNLLLVD